MTRRNCILFYPRCMFGAVEGTRITSIEWLHSDGMGFRKERFRFYFFSAKNSLSRPHLGEKKRKELFGVYYIKCSLMSRTMQYDTMHNTYTRA